METVLLSAIMVAIAEIGGKTQFLTILLAARF
jgi:putative Ca2+/H+ antiporter (TMEM165/GDT1 family)